MRLGCRTFGLFAILTMVFMSIGSLEPLQYGLTVNWITRQVNPTGTNTY